MVPDLNFQHLLSSLRREMSKERGGLLGALCCPQIMMVRGE
jgi:hypothetical protein